MSSESLHEVVSTQCRILNLTEGNEGVDSTLFQCSLALFPSVMFSPRAHTLTSDLLLLAPPLPPSLPPCMRRPTELKSICGETREVSASSSSSPLFNPLLCCPLRQYLDQEVALSEELVHKYSDMFLARLNKTICELRRLFLVEDLVDSIKVRRNDH